MSSSLMSTAPGGEQTQYEASAPDMAPHKTEAGQFGANEPQTAQPTTSSRLSSAKGEANTHGITPADKIRYGQSIQESGMGGKTGTVSGEADAAGDEDGTGEQRRRQGYGGEEGAGIGA